MKKYLKIEETSFDYYLKRLYNIIKIKNPNKKNMEKIVKLYLYILQYRKQLKKYKISYIGELLKNFVNVINNTLKFFQIKQQNDIHCKFL